MAGQQDWSRIGEQVRQVRLSAGMSQQELADSVGLDRTMLAKIEAGNRRLDGVELARLSRALNVSMEYLIEPRPAVVSRRSAVLTEETDTQAARASERLEIALIEWLRNVRQLADIGTLRAHPLARYPGTVTSDADARQAAQWLRQQTSLGNEPIDSILGLCERAGQWVLVTDLPGDGASLIDAEFAVAVVSTAGDPGRRRATAAHELGHLILGDEYSSDLGVNTSRADREAVIDAFAAELLLPMAAVVRARDNGPVTRETLIDLAARYRTSWLLALRQAEQANIIDIGTRRAWSNPRPSHAEFMEALGWTPQPDLTTVRVPPSYAHAVIEAWRSHRITRARAVELMHGQITDADLPEDDDQEIAP
ncbi:helix-turn-helix domain-containing protein [Micromonospora sp. NBC_01813]|uniref:helix-turn-helix domain-containing protein n=1 Tax=Micromonospora sp. NBC_01813 TaxID=2975988 RepID=UPI002DDAA90B|nr:XRE family transcriptional regulator [Micromonospora sp. NBC_01813]WSA08399.1 XRE family transcriptional regulator [Micromonospora sp. NBC_01813]